MRRTDDGYEFNADETNAVVWVWCIDQQFERNDTFLRTLAKACGRHAQYASARKMLGNTLDAMIKIMSPHQKDRLKKTLETRSIQLVVKNVALHELDGLRLLHDSDLDTLIDAATKRGECSMCMKDVKEAQKCRLRKIMTGIQPPQEHNPYRCEYQDIGI